MTTTAVALLDSIRTHLLAFELPALWSVNVTRSLSGPNVTAQLACHEPPDITSALLAWADTLTGSPPKPGGSPAETPCTCR